MPGIAQPLDGACGHPGQLRAHDDERQTERLEHTLEHTSASGGAAATLCARSRRPAGRRNDLQASSAPRMTHGQARSAPGTTYGRLEHALERSARLLSGRPGIGLDWDYHRVDRRLVIPAIYLLQSPRVLHQELVQGLSRPGRWCRPSRCSIWWNARFNDFSHTLGFRSSKTPPQTHQSVLRDGLGIGAHSKSKLLRLVRYCDEVEE